MFFCPKCSFMLDISKYSENNTSDDKYIIYSNTNNFIDDVIKEKIKKNNEYKITFQLNNLKNSNKFKKLVFNCSLTVCVPVVIFTSFKGKATPIVVLLLTSNGFILLVF